MLAQVVPLAEARGLVTVVIAATMYGAAWRRMARADIARCPGTQGSGILSSLAWADGLLVVPETMATVAPGTRLPVD